MEARGPRRDATLQWHITDQCNLRCAHCYQDDYSRDELAYADLLEILRQYQELLRAWRKRARNGGPRGHITVTGGEPFVRRDFLDLLDVFHRCAGRDSICDEWISDFRITFEVGHPYLMGSL